MVVLVGRSRLFCRILLLFGLVFFILALVVWSRRCYLLEAPQDRGTVRDCGFVVVVLVELAPQTGWTRI